MVDLSKFNNEAFDRGAPSWKELLWRMLQQGFFNVEWIKALGLKRWILRRFGAKLETGVVVKPKAKITFPWKLTVGANSWIGEEAWLLNLEHITIGSNVCISQRAFLCTGSHDWAKESFDLIVKPIIIEDGAWICADVFIGSGVTVGENSVVTAGSVVTKDLPPDSICSGNPCVAVKKR
ncbi:MAG: putative colanic acid biosynthesis acetyltransferase [Verrucomicrobiota bacterium]